MAKDRRPYFTMTNEYPRHRKIRGLSDAAFRLHVTLIALANEETRDGLVSDSDLLAKGSKAKKELITAGLVVGLPDGTFALHDYLKHQNSAEEIARYKAEQKERGQRGGLKSAHTRHHVNKGRIDPNCALCPGAEPPEYEPKELSEI
ncbi:hypothetical protein [Arthrobacter sp. EpRS71]|uniref:hypothetical protein n=1 Tax=Arthrobacter sp. EpRS71 TaxID=1743141 RepID=UPI00074B2007|nr:hypothetical protein [Arthrobacter sp. EpRS71]KUM34564.1 hypothetical protein AR689_10505 [Arthrobacter sp. EpRS71]